MFFLRFHVDSFAVLMHRDFAELVSYVLYFIE